MPRDDGRSPTGNLILDRLPPAERDRLAPATERVDLELSQVIHRFGEDVEHVYFPTTALASLLTVLDEDDPVEATTVGREGLVGATIYLGLAESPQRVICQMAGGAIRVPAGAFCEATARCPALADLTRRFLAFSMRNAYQALACNASHMVEARAGRWLLMVHDQAGRDEFAMTQEFLARMLGVRRQTVTVVAGGLQSAGLIRYRRGHVAVVDRVGLEDVACECYAAIRGYYAGLFG